MVVRENFTYQEQEEDWFSDGVMEAYEKMAREDITPSEAISFLVDGRGVYLLTARSMVEVARKVLRRTRGY